MRRKRKYDSQLQEQTIEREEPVVIEQSELNKVQYAYSIIEADDKYTVISVEYDPDTLVLGKVNVVESNTDKFLMQERLRVLLMGDDLI